jgi:hypothetical protein
MDTNIIRRVLYGRKSLVHDVNGGTQTEGGEALVAK